jgi:Fe-S-cluster-containing hydrogenase component 2
MYAVDEDLCTGCGICLEYCRSGAMKMPGRSVEIEEGLCTSCGACAEVCPLDAIYEYEEVPALREGMRELAPAIDAGSSPAVAEKRATLARQQKVAAAAVLLPTLSRLVVRLAGRVLPRGGGRSSATLQQPTLMAGRGGHRWHGGR